MFIQLKAITLVLLSFFPVLGGLCVTKGSTGYEKHHLSLLHWNCLQSDGVLLGLGRTNQQTP